MTVVFEFWMLLLLIAILAVLVAPRFVRVGPRGATEDGTLLITGVSPRPDAGEVSGAQYAMITGVLHGPSVNEHEVYRRLVRDVGDWPTVGELLPVVYSTRNPDNWNIVSPPTGPDT